MYPHRNRIGSKASVVSLVFPVTWYLCAGKRRSSVFLSVNRRLNAAEHVVGVMQCERLLELGNVDRGGIECVYE